MAHRYPTLDRLFALLMTLVVTANGTAMPDTDYSDYSDDGDGGASTADESLLIPDAISSERARRLAMRAPVIATLPADTIWTTDAALPTGAVAIGRDAPSTALISVVASDADDGHVASLLKRALIQCRDAGDLKVVISAPTDDIALRAIAEPLGFVLSRSWRDHDRTVLELYTNLYARAPERREATAQRLTSP